MNTRILILLSALTVLLSSCETTEAPREAQGSFSVKVVPYFGNNVRVYIQAYEQRTGEKRGPSLGSRRVTGDGVTGFLVPLGKTYSVSAYADLDKDGKQGPNDPSASINGLKPEADVNAEQPPAILTLPGAGESPEWPRKKGADGREAAGKTGDETSQKGSEKPREAAPQLPPPVPPPPR